MQVPDRENGMKQPKLKSRKWLWIKVVLSLLIVIISLVFIFNGRIMAYWVQHQSSPNAYIETSKEEMKANAAKADKDGNFDSESAVPVSPENLVKAALSSQDLDVIGGIAVPELGINLPILSDDGDYSMLYGAGPLQAGQVMGEGNYTLASHDMWTNANYYSESILFSPLQKAASGQMVYLTNKDKVYKYEVYDVQRIKPSEWDLAVNEIAGKKTVTLITCDADDSYRIMVRGQLISVSEFNDDTAKPFVGDMNQYQG